MMKTEPVSRSTSGEEGREEIGGCEVGAEGDFSECFTHMHAHTHTHMHTHIHTHAHIHAHTHVHNTHTHAHVHTHTHTCRSPKDAVLERNEPTFVTEIRDAVINGLEVEKQSANAYQIWSERDEVGAKKLLCESS